MGTCAGPKRVMMPLQLSLLHVACGAQVVFAGKNVYPFICMYIYIYMLYVVCEIILAATNPYTRKRYIYIYTLIYIHTCELDHIQESMCVLLEGRICAICMHVWSACMYPSCL